ncbi:helix-turn-helix transcriptional regulator [Cohaesibacter sp. CAU 1516]|uniref:helix-turn-helix transcriptional regulator n=1 Tax=Cohaesibacter sp. CAU 1516 TaxID=2576038 RepID=UPI001FEE6756|nr:helix-turn-helix transcriptional regulator [Cohaesibacter sp. CAU 1516]
MLSHTTIWSAIDRLASENSLTASGLARLAGLDATSFNPSKRFKPDGRPRWPSTESISKVLAATDTSVEQFFTGSELEVAHRSHDPASHSEAAELSSLMPLPQDTTLWEVSGGEFYPFYKDGAQLLILKGDVFDVGDRLIVKTNSDDLLLGDVSQTRSRSFSLSMMQDSGRVRTFSAGSVDWVARILWASQ